MTTCASCSEILGRPESVEPHPKLKPQSGRKLLYGWHEIYACRECGSLLQRVAIQPGAAASAGEPWSLVPKSPEPRSPSRLR